MLSVFIRYKAFNLWIIPVRRDVSFGWTFASSKLQYVTLGLKTSGKSAKVRRPIVYGPIRFYEQF